MSAQEKLIRFLLVANDLHGRIFLSGGAEEGGTSAGTEKFITRLLHSNCWAFGIKLSRVSPQTLCLFLLLCHRDLLIQPRCH